MLDAEYGAKIRLVRKPQAGHPAARNTGIGAATGEFLSFLDHDDLWPEDKTAIQMECFAADAALDMVLGHLENFFDDELTAEDRRKIAAPMHPLEGLHPGTMLVRRSSFDRVGLFCETEQMGDFLDWYGRATIRGLKMKMLPQTLMRRRIHTTNFSRTHTSLRRHYLVRLKHLLDMRRVEAAKNGL
jgi:glycosyltransferase involved in cell wall biosynthesis